MNEILVRIEKAVATSKDMSSAWFGGVCNGNWIEHSDGDYEHCISFHAGDP